MPGDDDPERGPDRPRPDRRRWLPTHAQRRGLALIVIVAAGAMALVQLTRPTNVADPMAATPTLYSDLADRLDPNTATAAELGVLPGLGPSKAGAIVEYRDSVTPPAYRELNDLTRVRGIGPAIAAKLAPYLAFPE